MPRKLPSKDVVIVGLGWAGSIMAQELTEAGLEVVAIERGPWRDAATEFASNYVQDELRYGVRRELDLRPEQATFTFRNKMSEMALPIRDWGAFMPANGVGGGGVTWNGATWRFLPSDFTLKTHLVQRYGAGFLPKDITISDWGVTYDELEPFYDRFEYLCGASGAAGNLNGQILEGGNPFEGARSRPYPNPPMQQPFSQALFAKAAANLGYKPFPKPSGVMSQAYVNPLGVRLGPCAYCGFCESYGCGNQSKASPQTTILPVLIRKANFTARANSEATRINLDKSGKRAASVTFIDASGEEWEQPADLVILAADTLFNVQLLLLSGIGKPYDPVANQGVIGRNFTHKTTSDVLGFFDKARFNFNPFVGSGGAGMCIDEFNGDNFDHGPHGFVGGGVIGQMQSGAPPIRTNAVPPGAPRWGAQWKQALRDNYLSTVTPGLGVQGGFYAYRDIYLDLDPTYRDRLGRPLLRLTIDFHENELKQNKFLTDRFADIVKAMGAEKVVMQARKGPYDITKFQTNDLSGGAIMGDNPQSSAVNRYLQSWNAPNLFVMGASAFPQNAGYSPTATLAALAFWTAKAIREKYLQNPGALIHA